MMDDSLEKDVAAAFVRLDKLMKRLEKNWYYRGLTEDEINGFEQELNVALPTSLRIARKYFDGFSGGFSVHFDSEREPHEITNMYALEDWAKAKNEEKEVASYNGFNFENTNAPTVKGPVLAKSWHEKWMLLGTSTDASWFVDFDPLPGGKVGQIILVDMNEPLVQVVASDFLGFMQLAIASLERAVEEGEWP
jgi:cell wall assembly regulator SMI1